MSIVLPYPPNGYPQVFQQCDVLNVTQGIYYQNQLLSAQGAPVSGLGFGNFGATGAALPIPTPNTFQATTLNINGFAGNVNWGATGQIGFQYSGITGNYKLDYAVELTGGTGATGDKWAVQFYQNGSAMDANPLYQSQAIAGASSMVLAGNKVFVAKPQDVISMYLTDHDTSTTLAVSASNISFTPMIY